jgi:pimeloyl-ACP methyl ester carboxylesterase
MIEGYYPTRFYAKWIVMLAALDMLRAFEDRAFLRSALGSLLLQKPLPPAPPGLTADGARWYRLATLREDPSDPELTRRIEEHLVARVYHHLDPAESLSRLRCPAFLLHGAYDDLIPPSESLELHRRIEHSYLLVSPFLTHTHPSEKSLSLRQKAGAVFKAVVFCHHLARVIR